MGNFNEFGRFKKPSDMSFILKKEITPDVAESRLRDTDETLAGYRENLENRGVNSAKIDEFIQEAREGINREYEDLDSGKEAPELYLEPTDWDKLAQELREGETEEMSEPSDSNVDWDALARNCAEGTQDDDF